MLLFFFRCVFFVDFKLVVRELNLLLLNSVSKIRMDSVDACVMKLIFCEKG